MAAVTGFVVLMLQLFLVALGVPDECMNPISKACGQTLVALTLYMFLLLSDSPPSNTWALAFSIVCEGKLTLVQQGYRMCSTTPSST